MAKVKIEDVIEHLDFELKRALEDTVLRTFPGIKVDRVQLFREFRKAVGRRCSTWEAVPDQFVEKQCHHCHKGT